MDNGHNQYRQVVFLSRLKLVRYSRQDNIGIYIYIYTQLYITTSYCRFSFQENTLPTFEIEPIEVVAFVVALTLVEC